MEIEVTQQLKLFYFFKYKIIIALLLLYLLHLHCSIYLMRFKLCIIEIKCRVGRRAFEKVTGYELREVLASQLQSATKPGSYLK